MVAVARPLSDMLSFGYGWINVSDQVDILTTYTQGSNEDWKTWKMKMVMEKSWNMKNWPKVMDFFVSVMEFYQFCIFSVAAKKLSSDLKKSAFSAKCCKFKIGQRDGHGKSRNGRHGKVMEKYFVKSVGTLYTADQ